MIREDALLKVTAGMFGSIRNKERIIFLFSDLLMWTSPSYQYKGKMSLAAARLEKSRRNPLGIELSSSQDLATLIFPSKIKMEEWIKDFEEGKKYAKQIRERLRQVKRRTLDTKRGEAHTLVMNAFKTLNTSKLLLYDKIYCTSVYCMLICRKPCLLTHLFMYRTRHQPSSPAPLGLYFCWCCAVLWHRN